MQIQLVTKVTSIWFWRPTPRLSVTPPGHPYVKMSGGATAQLPNKRPLSKTTSTNQQTILRQLWYFVAMFVVTNVYIFKETLVEFRAMFWVTKPGIKRQNTFFTTPTKCFLCCHNTKFAEMYRANMYTGDGDETHIQINIYSITMTDEGHDILTKSTWMHHNEGNYIFVSCSCNSEQGAQTGLGNKEILRDRRTHFPYSGL